MNVLQRWLSAATPPERDALVRGSGISLATLRQMAGAYRTEGVLRMLPGPARRIELTAHRIWRSGLPVLRRSALCPACGGCEYAKKCGG